MIKYDKTIQLTTQEWPAYTCNHYPSIFDIKDSPGSSVLVCGPGTADRFWITGTVRSSLISEASQENIPAPTTQFSESFLLKLVAVSRDANLIKDLNL